MTFYLLHMIPMHYSELNFNLFCMQCTCRQDSWKAEAEQCICHILDLLQNSAWQGPRGLTDGLSLSNFFFFYDRHMSKRLPMLPLSHIFPLMPLLVSGAAGLNSHEAAPCDATYQGPTSDSLTVCAMIMKRIYIGCCTFSSVLYVYGLCSHTA